MTSPIRSSIASTGRAGPFEHGSKGHWFASSHTDTEKPWRGNPFPRRIAGTCCHPIPSAHGRAPGRRDAGRPRPQTALAYGALRFWCVRVVPPNTTEYDANRPSDSLSIAPIMSARLCDSGQSGKMSRPGRGSREGGGQSLNGGLSPASQKSVASKGCFGLVRGVSCSLRQFAPKGPEGASQPFS